MELRERGIYRLAGWREFVAARGRDGSFCLFTPQSWEAGGVLDYRVMPSGRLVYRGAITSWSVGDLADTGETAAPQRRLKSAKPDRCSGKEAA